MTIAATYFSRKRVDSSSLNHAAIFLNDSDEREALAMATAMSSEESSLGESG